MNAYDPFLRPSPRHGYIDRYVARSAILRELKAVLTSIRGRVLDVGCGQQPYKPVLLSPPSRAEEYVGLDVPNERYGIRPDVFWDGVQMPFDNEVFDFAIATEVLEHCPEPVKLLAEVARVLKPDGRLFFTVPFIWPLHEVPHDEYRYTPFALDRLVKLGGFSHVTLRALGGWDASLAQLLGLWVKRRPMSRWKRALISRMLAPIVRTLARRDQIPEVFSESTMITGLSGVAFKGRESNQLQPSIMFAKITG